MNNSASTNTRGTSFYDLGLRTPRTIDRSRPPEPEKIAEKRTSTQIAADFYFDELMAKEKRERETHRQREAEALAKQKRAQAEEERKQKRGSWEMQERLIDETLDRHPLSAGERHRVRDIIFQTDYTAERCEIECLTIIAAKQEGQLAIAKLRECCDDSEWKQILDTILNHRHEFTESEISSGAAHRQIWRKLFGV